MRVSSPLIYGIALFIWLRLEDNAVWTAAAFGVGLAFLATNAFLNHKDAKNTKKENFVSFVPSWFIFSLRGALSGGGGAVAAALLMLLKVGSHAHAFPDYPVGVILAMLERAPIWAAAGALIGAGMGCLRRTQTPDQKGESIDSPTLTS